MRPPPTARSAVRGPLGCGVDGTRRGRATAADGAELLERARAEGGPGPGAAPGDASSFGRLQPGSRPAGSGGAGSRRGASSRRRATRSSSPSRGAIRGLLEAPIIVAARQRSRACTSLATPSPTRRAPASPASPPRTGRRHTGSWTPPSWSCCFSSPPPTRAWERSFSACTGIRATFSLRLACRRARRSIGAVALGYEARPAGGEARPSRRGRAPVGDDGVAPGAPWRTSSTWAAGSPEQAAGRRAGPPALRAGRRSQSRRRRCGRGDVRPGLCRLDDRLGPEGPGPEVHHDVGDRRPAVMGEVVEEQVTRLELVERHGG